MDSKEPVGEISPTVQRILEDPLCRKFVLWLESQGQWKAMCNSFQVKLCLSCLLEGEWSLEKAKEFVMGEIC